MIDVKVLWECQAINNIDNILAVTDEVYFRRR